MSNDIIKLDNVSVGFSHLTSKNTFKGTKFEIPEDKASYDIDLHLTEEQLNTLTAGFDVQNTNAKTEADLKTVPDSLVGKGLTKIRAKSKYQPKIFDSEARELDSAIFIPPGSIVNVLVKPNEYTMRGESGLNYYINSIQIVERVEPKGAFEATTGTFLSTGARDIELT